MTLSSEFAGKRRWPLFAAAIVVGGMVAFFGAAWLVVYNGIFDIAADTPHSQPVYWLMQNVRQRSIAVRAVDVVAPNDLGDTKRVVSGAAQYAGMCSICHLGPGERRTEISRGLYPRAPELRRGSELTPAEVFWVVKHGIKMTGMPAWGTTHDDHILWDVVAFLRKMPELTAEEYQALIKSAPKTHGEMMQQMDIGSGHEGHKSQQ